MTFSDFTLESVEIAFGLTTNAADLFPTDEARQFLRLSGTEVTLHDRRLFIDDLPAILTALRACLPA